MLQSDQDDANAASSARIEELEQDVADLQQRLDAQLSAAEDAQVELDLARSQLEDASAELGAKGQALEESQAELAEACLSAVADVLEELYASDGGPEALEQAADELEEIAGDCAPEQ